MKISEWRRHSRGPFRADQVRNRSGYEITNGHPVLSVLSTRERVEHLLRAAMVLRADPGVGWVGTRVGYALDAQTLRCADVVVEPAGTPLTPLAGVQAARLTGALVLASDPAGVTASLWGVPRGQPSPAEALNGDASSASWMETAPSLAVELVEAGRDEGDLAQKIDELLSAGTRHLWAVRLSGPRRVEVYDATGSSKVFSEGRELRADGVLERGLPVDALFDDVEAARHVRRVAS